MKERSIQENPREKSDISKEEKRLASSTNGSTFARLRYLWRIKTWLVRHVYIID